MHRKNLKSSWVHGKRELEKLPLMSIIISIFSPLSFVFLNIIHYLCT